MTKFRNRLLIFFIISCCLMGALVGRLFYIQVTWSDELTAMARNQQNKNIPIPAKRGDILDRNGDKLAFSIKTFSIWVKSSAVKNPHDTAVLIADALGADAAEIQRKIVDAKTVYVKLVSDLDKRQGDLIRSKGIKGVSVTEDNKRIYPYDNLASHVIGNVNADNDGYVGIEYAMNTVLKGTEGKYFVTTDVHGRQLPYGEDTLVSPLNGNSVKLTIDDTIQYFVEERLEAAMIKHTPISASAIVMDPMTGEILAMASKPDYNLNDPRAVTGRMEQVAFDALSDEEKSKYWNEMWRNIVIGNTYEPGSVLKAITAAIALNEELVNFNTKFVCNGVLKVAGVSLHCWIYPSSHGEETFLEGLRNSCNIVSIHTIDMIGLETYYKYLELFGFFEVTGIGLPAEAGSISIPKDKVGPVELATMSYGHGINVTMIQVVRAVSALVNGGYLLEPHIVKEVINENGEVVNLYPRTVVRQVITEATSEKMKVMLEAVVDGGTGKNAYIEGIRVGGKTGSSRKFEDGSYQEDNVVASFVGIAPIDAPQFIIYVVVDGPQDEFGGGSVAAPIAKAMLEDILRYNAITPAAKDSKMIKAPNLVGLSYEDASKKLNEMKISFSTDPITIDNVNLLVVDQYPAPDTQISDKAVMILSVGDAVSDEAENNE
ncbi:penicillin-binding transpeptidase domain-containing protein [Fusibacter sp. 3D3]|uniref:penicillin-binding transpeptidase domain-containing protein n=1 Tax=Fusibacter sp. 3D3 TaxID=1048380 RepID=UPI000853E358|nr:penicillin-binding transpeptidase domain-containing protein [Fusibacter sp. 3D3]GAU78687.1 peptidoglycan synthetase FtsI [Fusibacter sp. 3D3]